MAQLVLEPTATAQWQALVSEAEAACECHLNEELESYLVFLLMRFAARPDLAGRVMAVDYLRSCLAQGYQQREQLRDVGDQCLLFSGFFPEQAERRLVRISYFVNLGRSAYDMLAQRLENAAAEIYLNLAEGFVNLRDVLQAIRELDGEPSLGILQQLELWADTGSRLALKTVQAETDAVPVVNPSEQLS